MGLNRLTLDVFHDKEQLFPPHSQAHTYIDTTAIQKDDLEKSTHPFCTPTGGVNQVDTNSLISGCETLTSSRFEAVAGVFRVQVESERSTTHSDRSPLPLSHRACSTHLAYVMHTCTHSHTHAPTHKSASSSACASPSPLCGRRLAYDTFTFYLFSPPLAKLVHVLYNAISHGQGRLCGNSPRKDRCAQ